MPVTFIDKKKRDDKQLEELMQESMTDEKIIITSDAVYNVGVLQDTKKKTLPTDENIEDYKDFLISIGNPGAYSSRDEDYQKAIGVYKNYHILIKHTPYNVFPKVKEPVTQTWKDENGDDVWLPRAVDSNGNYVPLELHDAFDFEPSFVYYRKNPSDYGEATKMVTDFINAIKGRWLRFYDEYTGIGYDGVYLDSTDNDPKFKKRSYDHIEFTLHFRVNGTLTTVPFKTM